MNPSHCLKKLVWNDEKKEKGVWESDGEEEYILLEEITQKTWYPRGTMASTFGSHPRAQRFVERVGSKDTDH